MQSKPLEAGFILTGDASRTMEDSGQQSFS